MKLLVSEILDALASEKEENSFVSKELLDRTIVWIDRFKAYPDIEIDLNTEVSKVDYIKMLDGNYRQIITVLSPKERRE